jgi:hypothetical protein
VLARGGRKGCGPPPYPLLLGVYVTAVYYILCYV